MLSKLNQGLLFLVTVSTLFSQANAVATFVFELDGNAYSSTNEDWSTLYGGGGTSKSYSGVTADPAPLTAFKTGGSKDTNDISSWKHTDTSVPDKDDITNAYAASYVVNDTVYVYFGADRFAQDGDAALGVWFFQENIQVLQNGQFSGLHKNGDLLLVSNFGSDQEITVYKWENGNLVLLFSDNNAVCNSDSSQTVCAITNSVEIPSPWPYVPKDGTANMFPPTAFVEGGVNLNQLFGGKENIPCFTSFLAVTRSSTSLNAQLKDFVLNEFKLCSVAVNLDCHSATIDSTKTTVNYDYTVTVENDGFGTLSNVTVFYDGSPVANYPSLNAGETRHVNGSFSTTTQSPSGGTASATAYLTPTDQLTVNALPSTCPFVELVPNATLVVTCLDTVVDDVNEKYVYSYNVHFENTGFGNLTVYELGVFTSTVTKLHSEHLGRTLTPTGLTTALTFNSTLDSLVWTDTFNGSVTFIDFRGSHLNKVDESNTCPPVTILPNVTVSKACQSSLQQLSDKLVVYVNFSGSVCNTGNIRLKNLQLVDDLGTVDSGDDFVFNVASLDKSTCQQYSGSYYPTSTASDYVFSDTVDVVATVALNLGTVNATATATCPLCP
jgi:hypothetical protein